MRGRCYYGKQWITIPLWAIEKKGKGYWVYYIAHELAHTSVPLYCEPHGREFQEELKRLCPQEFVHHELEYQERHATAAGITKEHAHKATDVQVIDIFDLL
jgi:predicted metal-dependent hydrolase